MVTSRPARLVSRALVAALALTLLAPAAAASPRAAYNPDDPDDPYVPHLFGPPPAVAAVEEEEKAFDHDFGISAYYSRWAGSYDAGGVGFRIRWEPLDLFGVEVFSELLDVTVSHGTRINLPSGFNLYVPLELVSGFRVRALAGLCSMITFDTAEGGSDSQDVQFGVHVGVGAEVALSSQLSLFLDATYQGYWGHARALDAWTAAVEDELSRMDNVQVGLGLQFHL
ncbi:MAG: hypothetical protein EP329_20640 [Deltaproteobacteria bacterium]|nr:MAG: hypothetical protein EP329_20640 [Deltaproteobacteria bacterium]